MPQQISFLNRIRQRLSSDATSEVEYKSSQTAPLFAVEWGAKPRWLPRDTATLAREGFQKNPIVYRAVRLIAEAAASVSWLLYEGAQELDTHPLLTLLNRPNPKEAGTSLMEAVYGHLLLSGNAYLEAVVVNRQVKEIYALRPDRMRVVVGTQGWPDAYEYTVGNKKIRFPVIEGEISPILHLCLFHPLDDHYGLSPLEAAQTALELHNASAAWNKALLDNSARPSGALVYQPGSGANLSREQFERLKTELESSFQGSRNAGRPMLLEGGLDWKSLSLSPRDMDFIAAKEAAARDIALAIGVPPMLLGIPGDNTYANYQEANRVFWRQTVLPLVGRTAASISHWLNQAYNEDLRLWYDADEISALSSEREALWNRINAASFLTEDEKRAATGYGPANK